MQYIRLIIIPLVILTASLLFDFTNSLVDLKVAGQTLQVEVVATSEKRAKGLMNREELGEKNGMLFVYEGAFLPSFWMKNTLIPLDIIFIGEDKKIVYIEKNAQPCRELKSENCPKYKTPYPAQFVLELNAGFSEIYGLKIGHEVDF